MKYLLLLILAIAASSCNSQDKINAQATNHESKQESSGSQIAQYVVNVYEDANGNLWFGTLEKGVAKYDGETLAYFTTNNGLPSNRVTGIIEDSAGNLWFGTGDGLSKYDGKTFQNFSEKNGLGNATISNMFVDSKGVFWIGSWGGVYKFDGNTFNPFPLPIPKVETHINEDTKDWITEIKEDSQGNMWFARDGYGACKYDGKTFTHFLKKDGLYSNNVTEIHEDHLGNIWFATRVAERDNADPEKRFGKGGINKYDGTTFTSFPSVEGFNNNDVFEIYRDQSNNIWIATTQNGVYRFDGKDFKNYDVPVSVMVITEDSKGNLWLGGAGGLYKINLTGKVVNVTTNGPWE